MSGYWKLNHKDYWAVVWGGIIYPTAQDVVKCWQQLFGRDTIEVVPCNKSDAMTYETAGFDVVDLEEAESWNDE